MEIRDKDKQQLKGISSEYVRVHSALNSLENQILGILDKKTELSSNLTRLRETELNLINKIEEENGITLTQEMLSEILN